MSLSNRLSEQFSSLDEIYELIVPPLDVWFHQFSEPKPALVQRFSRGPGSEDGRSQFLKRQLPLTQWALLTLIWPVWSELIDETIFDLWFIPDAEESSPMAISAYAVLTSALKPSKTIPDQARIKAVTLLAKLVTVFNIDKIHKTLPSADEEDDTGDVDSQLRAESYASTVDALFSSADLAANWMELVVPFPHELEWREHYTRITVSYCNLLKSLEVSHFPLSKMVRLSRFMEVPNRIEEDKRSFIWVWLSNIVPALLNTRSRIPESNRLYCSKLEDAVILSTQKLSSYEQEKYVLCLFDWIKNDLIGHENEALRQSVYLCGVFLGTLRKNSPFMTTVVKLITDSTRQWPVELADCLIQWISHSSGHTQEDYEWLFNEVLETWSSEEVIRKASEQTVLFLTSLLLQITLRLSPGAECTKRASRSPKFINSITTFLSIIQVKRRYMGMIVAETISQNASANTTLPVLSFGEVWKDSPDAPEILELKKRASSMVSFNMEKNQIEWKAALLSLIEKAFLPQTYKTEPTAASQISCKEDTAPLSSKRLGPTAPLIMDMDEKGDTGKKPLISIIGDEEEEEFLPYKKIDPPVKGLADILETEDASLYASAITSGSSLEPNAPKRFGQLRPPVYIREISSYLRGQKGKNAQTDDAEMDAQKVELALKYGPSLVRRKKGWGMEMEENAVDLTFAVIHIRDDHDIENFAQMKHELLLALVIACPKTVVGTLIEQYFSRNNGLDQRFASLRAIAFGARELSGLENKTPGPKTETEADVSFPSKQLPAAQHYKLLKKQIGYDELDHLASQVVALSLRETRESSENTIPEAKREMLMRVKKFNHSRTVTKSDSDAKSSVYLSLALETFILPLVNHFWNYLKDERKESDKTPILAEALLLGAYLNTLCILVSCARNSLYFSTTIIPVVFELVFGLKPFVEDSSDGNENETLAGLLELCLIIVEVSDDKDHGNSLLRNEESAGFVHALHEWSQSVFDAQESRPGGPGRAGRAAAGCLLRLASMFEHYHGINSLIAS